MDEGFFAIDREWRFHYLNASAERFWGRKRGEMLGRSMLELFTRFEGSPAHAAHRRAMETGEAAQVETISTATGAPVRLRLFPTPWGLSVYFQDISSKKQMEQALQSREELLTLAEESAGVGVWVADLANKTVEATPQFYNLLGVEPVAGPVSQDFPRQFRHPDDSERVARGFAEALERGDELYEVEYRILRPSGEQRWIFGRGRVTRDNEGRPRRYAGVDIDITERKKQQEHLQTVMGELVHRSNNLLTVVQGLARQTAANSESLADFTPALLARLQGLAESNALLARQELRGVPLEDLIRGQIAPFADTSRFELDGQAVLLSPKAAQNLGMAFHELCTNAIKYGALSQAAGRVRISWRVADGGKLDLSWAERDGPTVAQPTRTGFGRVVAERLIAKSLDAEVSTSFEPQGLEWRLTLPPEQFSA